MEDEEKDLLDSSVGQWETGGRHSLMMLTSPKVSFIFDWRKREIRPVIMEGGGGGVGVGYITFHSRGPSSMNGSDAPKR